MSARILTGDCPGVLRAPFPWFGAKSRIASLVWSRFGDVPNMVEPFFGSGAVLLGRPHPPRLETVNDKDGFVSNFWRATIADPDAVAEHADWPVNECVPAGTMISTPSGDMPVEKITPGMVVYGYEGNQVVQTTVSGTSKNESKLSDIVTVGDLKLTKN